MTARIFELAAAMFAMVFLAGVARAAPACDVDALKQYPMREALKTRAIAFDMPEIFFKEPGAELKPWTPPDDKTRKDALARGIATLNPEERQTIMLAAISGWLRGRDPMVNFFVLPQGLFYDEAIATLDAAGLTDHAALFREGRALFGPDFGTDKQRYDRWSDGEGGIRDVMLDTQLMSLSRRYRALPDTLDIAAERISRSPELTAIFEPVRAATPDDVRLSYLGYALWNCVDHYGPPDQVSARLADLPDAYRHIVVTFVFQAEMLNGSVEQFFYNSSGTLAPDVVLALEAMKLPKHAAAVRKAIDMFPSPYPRELERRRDLMMASGEDFRNALSDLTGDVDDGEMQLAMLRMAREAGILPR